MIGQFSENYYLNPWPARVTFQDYDEENAAVGSERSAAIVEFDKDYRTFLLDEDVVLEPPEGGYTNFTVSRTDMNYSSLLPCWFFKNGAAEMEQWVMAFCAYMGNPQNWPEGLPPPSAVVISDEDIGEASIDWDNYKEYLNDSRASNSQYTIDGERTLSQWHIDFRPTEFDEEGNYSPPAGHYSPANKVAHSYLLATMQTAYNYHREQSTWQHFRALWPRAKLSQYQLGNGYGVGESFATAVPIGPGESCYHGQRTWHGPVSWDEYNAGLTFSPVLWDPRKDGQVVPVSYNAAWHSDETAGAGSVLSQVPMPNFSNSFSPTLFLNLGLPLFIEFLIGDNSGTLYEITGWAGNVFTVSQNLAVNSQVEDVVLYYPHDPVYLEWSLDPPDTAGGH